jgi:hypothetical protein
MRANKTLLSAIIEEAEALLEDADAYRPVSVDNLTAKLNAAKIVYGNASATQAEVNTAYQNLFDAVKEMLKKGDKAALQIVVNIASVYREANYTATTWTPFRAALDAATAVLNDANALQDPIDAATAALNDAMQSLARKADFAALQAAINAAQAVVNNIGDYVPSTVAGLANALIDARVALNNQDATQAQVNAATVTLNAELMKARLKPDRSALLSMQSRARSIPLALYTAASAEPLNTAMTNADEVLGASDEDITQEGVDAAANALANAISALQLRPSDAVNGGPDRTTSGVTDVTDPANDATSGDASAGKTNDNKADNKADDKAGSGSKSKTVGDSDKSTKSESKSKKAAVAGSSGGSSSAAGDGAAADADSAAADDAATTSEEPVIVADTAPEPGASVITGGGEGPVVIADEGVPTTSRADASGAPTGWLIAVIILAAAVCGLLWILFAKRKKEKESA